LALLAAITLGSLVPQVLAQQYIYQPDRDYYHNDTASGTVVGGALGAITGALVGGSKNREGGALIGAGVGALTGNVMGRAKDREDEQRTLAGASTVRALNQQAAATAVTNFDVVELTHAGVGDEVIISTMRSRGARMDLSPTALITLKQHGVSDRVVLAAQQMSQAPTYVAPAVPVTVTRVSPVIVTPAPYYYGPRYHHYHHPHHYGRGHGRHRSHAHVHIGF
jgi:uncharacterized protein YcfJ